MAAKARGKIPNGREEELWGQTSVQALGNQSHTGRGAEPAQSLGLNHKHGCEASAVAVFPTGRLEVLPREIFTSSSFKGVFYWVWTHTEQEVTSCQLCNPERGQSDGEGRQQPDIRNPNPLRILNFAFREISCHFGMGLLQWQDEETVVELPGCSCPTQTQIIGVRRP